MRSEDEDRDWRRWDEIIAYSSDDDDTVLFYPDLPREERHPNLAAVRCCCQYKPNIWDSSGSENVNKRRSDTSEAWSGVNRDVKQETAMIGMTAITSLDGLSYKWTCFRSTRVSDVIVKS